MVEYSQNADTIAGTISSCLGEQLDKLSRLRFMPTFCTSTKVLKIDSMFPIPIEQWFMNIHVMVNIIGEMIAPTGKIKTAHEYMGENVKVQDELMTTLGR